MRVAKIEQEEDVLMDETDYIAWETVWRLMTREDARAKWKELVSDPDHPGEGCGAERELYIVKEKKKQFAKSKSMKTGLTRRDPSSSRA